MKGITTVIFEYINDVTMSGMIFAVYLTILVVFAFFDSSLNGGDIKKTNLDDFRTCVIFPGILMFFGVFIGIPITTVLGLNITDNLVRPRYAWILMSTAVISLTFSFYIKKIECNTKKMLAIFSVCVLVFFVGEHKITSYVFQKAENLYKFPQSVVDITEKCLSEIGEPRIVVPVSSAYPFRQISSSIKLLYGDDAGYGRIQAVGGVIKEVADQMETSEPDMYFIADVCREYDCDYIVLDCIYMEFGGENINDNEYESSHTYIGDRTPFETESDGIDHSKELSEIPILKDGENRYWDFSSLGLEYVETYGQYLLYSIK